MLRPSPPSSPRKGEEVYLDAKRLPIPSLVTIILPVRNEARYIARCLDAVIAQDYPREQIEILVVDGMSGDGTRAVVTEFSGRDARVTMLDNLRGTVSTALNIGLVHARGDIILRVDGHTVISSDYVRLCVEILSEVDVWCVGGAIETVGDTRTARAIAIAQSSPFGVGGAAFRYARNARYVDTLAFGAYRREVFERVGTFDEELVRNQDDEFNFRLIRAGGRIWLDPRIRSQYFSRATWRGLWKQYFDYGFWKVRVIQKHHRPASWRHLAPGALVFALAANVGASLAIGSSMPFALVAGVYLGAVLIAALWTSARRGASAAWVFIAFLILHIGYGAGFWVGMAKWNFGGGKK